MLGKNGQLSPCSLCRSDKTVRRDTDLHLLHVNKATVNMDECYYLYHMLSLPVVMLGSMFAECFPNLPLSDTL